MPFLPATTADFVSNTTANSNESVTGATVPAPASRVIEFEFEGTFDVAATTTGVGFGVTIPSGATLSAIQFVTGGASASTTVQTTELLTASDTYTNTANSAVTTGNRFRVSGRCVVSTTEGSIQLRVDKDAAAAVTVKKGVTRWYQDTCAA